MCSLLYLITTVIQLYIYVIIIQAVMSWLLAFNVINMHNAFVASVARALYQLTEPALRPIRNVLPNLGGLDISPVILILGLIFVQNLIYEYSFGACF